jgi:hypothetical protein
MRPETLDSEENLDHFLAAFASCTLPKEQFTHAGHITVAASYLFQSSATQVLPQIRIAIRRFNESVGGANTETAGYHETLTVFWLRIVEAHLNQNQPASRLQATRLAVSAFSSRSGLHKDYYSGDVVQNTIARRQWLQPDLRPL